MGRGGGGVGVGGGGVDPPGMNSCPYMKVSTLSCFGKSIKFCREKLKRKKSVQ